MEKQDGNKKHIWRVSIPYYHVFTVEATSKEEAIEKAHSEEGVIEAYDDEKTEAEIVDDVFR